VVGPQSLEPRSTLPRFIFAADFLLAGGAHILDQTRIPPPGLFADLLAAALSAGDSFFDFLPAFFGGLAFFQGGFRAICISALTVAQATDRRSAPRHLGH
jgi:hypothetical protein